MDPMLISHDLLQRVRECERMIEDEMRTYPHWQALRETKENRHAVQPVLTMRLGGFGEWLRNRLTRMSGPANVNVNLNIAIVYSGAEPVGELVYGRERVEWNQLIDAIKDAVQSKLIKAGDDDKPVSVFVR